MIHSSQDVRNFMKCIFKSTMRLLWCSRVSCIGFCWKGFTQHHITTTTWLRWKLSFDYRVFHEKICSNKLSQQSFVTQTALIHFGYPNALSKMLPFNDTGCSIQPFNCKFSNGTPCTTTTIRRRQVFYAKFWITFQGQRLLIEKAFLEEIVPQSRWWCWKATVPCFRSYQLFSIFPS